jgi:hypothetical protein
MKNVGDISDVVQTQDGYEIIKLTGIRPARHQSFDEVKESIMDRNQYFEVGGFWDNFAQGMWAKAKIEWDPAEAKRRAKKEERERKYNEKFMREAAREEARRAKEAKEHPAEGGNTTAAPTEPPPTATPPPGQK